MAPEQADPRLAITPATDVWALGLLAFTVLTGRHYWLTTNVEGGTLQSLLAELFSLPLPSPSERLSELGYPSLLPPGFDGWFYRCVHRDASQRFPTAAEAWIALDPVLASAPPSSSSTPSLTPVAVSYRPTSPLAFAETAPPRDLTGPPVSAPPVSSPPVTARSPGLLGAAGATTPLLPSTPYPSSSHPSFPPHSPASLPPPTAPSSASSAPPTALSPAPFSSLASPEPAALALSPVSAVGAQTDVSTAQTGASIRGLATTGGPESGKESGKESSGAVKPRRSRRRWQVAAAGLLVAVAGGAGLLGWWLRPHERFCVDDLLLRAGPACIGELTEEEARQRAESYRLTSERGRVVRSERINGLGRLIPSKTGEASWHFSYSSGHLATIEVRDEHDRVRYRDAAISRRTPRRGRERTGRAAEPPRRALRGPGAGARPARTPRKSAFFDARRGSGAGRGGGIWVRAAL